MRAVRTGSICVALDSISELDPDPDDPLPWLLPSAMVAALRWAALVTGANSGSLRPLALVDSDDGPLVGLPAQVLRTESRPSAGSSTRARRPGFPRSTPTSRVRRLMVFGPSAGMEVGPAYDRQRAAAALAATSWTTVLVGARAPGRDAYGGPDPRGTEQVIGSSPRIGLCAPTGRAAGAAPGLDQPIDGLGVGAGRSATYRPRAAGNLARRNGAPRADNPAAL